MSNRAIVNVSTGRYVKGQKRLISEMALVGETTISWADELPPYSPTHTLSPYAFKAWALKAAEVTHGKDVLLWCDACIVPGQRQMADLWALIEKQGYWFAKNGWSNDEWTADSAYPDLFPRTAEQDEHEWLEAARLQNKNIPHVVATCFGLDLRTTIGKAFLKEYARLSLTKAFPGPWVNSKENPCGPTRALGHRHDQTAASVIAWRLGMELSNCPEYFAYKTGETQATCVIADGDY